MECKRISDRPRTIYTSTCNTDPKNMKMLSGMWDAFVNWEKRLKTEGPFLLRHLPASGKVFDARTGTGVDSIFLLKNGYAVTCNEPDPNFLGNARVNSDLAKVTPLFTSYDWLELEQHVRRGTFDAVICLGNAFTCLLDREDQPGALHNFLSILKDTGVLIVDILNYDYLLDEPRSIQKARKFRTYSGNYVYCGIDKVQALPVQISEDNIILEFTDLRTEEKAHLFAYPFRRTELYDIILETGFKSISFFSDYQPVLNSKADFYQFVCRR